MALYKSLFKMWLGVLGVEHLSPGEYPWSPVEAWVGSLNLKRKIHKHSTIYQYYDWQADWIAPWAAQLFQS